MFHKQLGHDILHKNLCCGYSLESPQQGDSNEYPQHMFLWRNKQIYPLLQNTLLICSIGPRFIVSSKGLEEDNPWFLRSACEPLPHNHS